MSEKKIELEGVISRRTVGEMMDCNSDDFIGDSSVSWYLQKVMGKKVKITIEVLD